MDHDFAIQSKDTVPITPGNNGESTPLKGSLSRFDKNSAEKATGDLGHGHQKNDSVGKYKNLADIGDDTDNHPELSGVQLHCSHTFCKTIFNCQDAYVAMMAAADDGSGNICTVSGAPEFAISSYDVDTPRSEKNTKSQPVQDPKFLSTPSRSVRFSPRDSASVWSLGSSTASSGTAVVRWYKHPKVREHWKVVVASFVLFFIGICLCIAGIILEALQVKLSGIFMLFVIGVFCFIPGVYHVIAVYYAVKGRRGFSFYNLPLFN